MEQTLVLVKPDGVKKNLIGDIIARFEHKGPVSYTHLTLPTNSRV